MATIHEPPRQVKPSVPEPKQKEPTVDPVAEDKERVRSDRIHATIVLLAVVAVFALIILLATLSPPPDGAEFQPWMMP